MKAKVLTGRTGTGSVVSVSPSANGRRPLLGLVGVAALIQLFATACLEPLSPLRITVAEVTDKISVEKLPTNTKYLEGMPFYTNGIEVTLIRNGWKTDVTRDVTYSWNGSPLEQGDTEITAQAGDKDVTVSYDENGTVLQTTFSIRVLPEGYMDGLVVAKLPATDYRKDEAFGTAGIEVRYFSEGGTGEDVTQEVTYSWSGGALEQGDTSITAELNAKIDVTVTYADAEVSTTFRIAVLPPKDMDGLALTSFPSVTQYGQGWEFQPGGISATFFKGGLAMDVTDKVTYGWDGMEIKEGNKDVTAEYGIHKEITVNYSHEGQDYGTSFTIDVLPEEQMNGLVVVAPPNVTEYIVGDPFQTKGIKVMHFSDGIGEEVTGFTYSWDGMEIQDGDKNVTAVSGTNKKITVSYQGEDTFFRINVLSNLNFTGIKIAELPRTNYGRNQEFQTNGIKIWLFEPNGARELDEDEVSYSWENVDMRGRAGKLEAGDKDVTADFGKKKITVTYEPQPAYTAEFFIFVLSDFELEGIVVTKLPKVDYAMDDVFSIDGIEITFFGGTGAVVLDPKKDVTYKWGDLTLVPGDSKDATQDFGPRTITVKYVSARLRAEYSTTFRIDVRPDYIPDGITVTRFPKQLYDKDDPFDTSNIQVMFYRDNGARDVSSEKDRITYSWNDGGTDRPLTHGSAEVTAQYGTKVITVHYSDSARKEWTTDFQIDVPSAELPDKKLVVTKLPGLVYKRLEPFSDLGIEVQFFSDGGSQAVPVTYRDATGNSFGNGNTDITGKLGNHEITVVYSDGSRRTEYTTYFKIEVIPNDTDNVSPSNGLVIESLPDVWEYPPSSGDLEYNKFRGEGMKVVFNTEKYSLDITKDPGVTYYLDGQAGTTYENFHPQLGDNAGPVIVNVKYGEAEAKFRVYVRTDIFYVYDGTTWDAVRAAITAGTRSAYTVYIVPNPVTGATDDVQVPAVWETLFPNRFGISVTLTTLPGKPMTLQLKNQGYLGVARGQMLIIDGQDETVVNPDGTTTVNPGPLTIRGRTDNLDPLFIVDGGGAYLELRNGIIRDNWNTDNISEGGGGVHVRSGGFFLMNGGEITGCQAMNGAAIYADDALQARTFQPKEKFAVEIKAGKIWNNTCRVFGSNSGGKLGASGIIFVTWGRVFMSGGEISGNSSTGGGGAIYLFNFGQFYMLNGIVYGDDAKAGEDTALQGETKKNTATGTEGFNTKVSHTVGSVDDQGRAYAVRWNNSDKSYEQVPGDKLLGEVRDLNGNRYWGHRGTFEMRDGAVILPK